MPIRRLNYTKRRKLTREQASVRLSPSSSGTPRTFDVTFDLPADLPGNACVYVEAYRTSPPARMRFAFGTAAAPLSPPADGRRLTEFDDDLPPPLFRIKVTDTQDQSGRLVADANQIKAVDPDAEPDHRKGILNIHHTDLDGLIWKVDFTLAGYEPTLYIDKVADAAKELGHDARFVALVFPEVLRQTLVEILILNPDDIDTPWRRRWYDFARALPGMAGDELASDAEDTDKQEWIGRAVIQFARKADVAKAFAPAAEDN